MVDKRLFSLVPGVRGLVVGKIICLWVGLVSDIALAGTVAVLVAALFPQTTVRDALQSIGIAGPSGFMLIGVAALAIAVVLEKGGSGGTVAAPIAQRVLNRAIKMGY